MNNSYNNNNKLNAAGEDSCPVTCKILANKGINVKPSPAPGLKA
jgi:hypothetical protein